jgi:HPt (histidine-containing phosphotransfer) domain-containing protein
MTAHAMADERERCLVLGMNGHVSKPIDPEILYSTLAGFNVAGGTVRPGPTTPPAMRAEPPPVAHEPGLPECVGLDVRSGLRHSGGNASLYSRLLHRFGSDFAGFGKALESMLSAGNWESVSRQAHTLKGLAASLGASELLPRAAALEQAARAHDILEVRRTLAWTLECLAPLVSALRLHYGIVDRAGSRATGVGVQVGMGNLDAAGDGLDDWLGQLRKMLRQADVDAKDLWESRRQEFEARLPSHVVHRISLALDKFDFDAALNLLPGEPER